MRYEEAIREAIVAEMRRDPLVTYICGDDPQNATFRLGPQLLDIFGAARVWDASVSNRALAGVAIGAALTGLRPIVELGFVDRMLGAAETIANEAAKMRYLTNGKLTAAMVLLAVQGMTRSGAQSSQSLEAIFAHLPGLTVALPSSAADAFGLMATAIRSADPIVVLADKRLWGVSSQVPNDIMPYPFGACAIVRPGRHATVVAIGYLVHEALRAADTLSGEGIEIEVLDPQTVVPLDLGTILLSVRRTGRLIVAHEAVQFAGIGAEIVAAVASEGHGLLKAAPKRVAMPFLPAPVSVQQIAEVLPSHRDIEAAVRAAVNG